MGLAEPLRRLCLMLLRQGRAEKGYKDTHQGPACGEQAERTMERTIEEKRISFCQKDMDLDVQIESKAIEGVALKML